MKASYTNQKRLPQKPPPPPAEDLREEWEKYLDEVNREEEMLEEIRDENIRNFLRSQRPWIILPPTFPHGSGFTNCAVSSRHKHFKNRVRLH